MVADGSAEVALGIYAAAKAQGLDFVPLLEERYDLVTPTSVYESGLLDPLLALLRGDSFKRARPLPRRLLDARDRRVTTLV